MNLATRSILIAFMCLVPLAGAQNDASADPAPTTPDEVVAEGAEAPATDGGATQPAFPVWAQPAKKTSLRANPSVHVPGLLDVGTSQPLKVVGERGAFSVVQVPQGFPIYLATAYLRIEPEKQLAWVTARNLNARFVPSTIGNLPVGKVSATDGALVMLGVEGDWARVLAPKSLTLFVQKSDLAVADGGVDSLNPATIRTLFSRTSSGREELRQARVLAWRATHPEWKQEDEWLAELMEWTARDLDGLDAAERALLDGRLDELEPRVTWNESREMIRALRDEVTSSDSATAAIERERVQAEEAVKRVRLAERRTAEALAREAKLLDLGLTFEGRGQTAALSGKIEIYEGADAARVFVLRVDETGEALKLTSARRAIDLDSLSGRTVTLNGRRLVLPSISGPIFVVESEE